MHILRTQKSLEKKKPNLNLLVHLEEQMNNKLSPTQKGNKNQSGNKIETRKTVERINKTKRWIFKKKKKMTNVYYLLRKQKTQINNIRNERGDITTGTTTIHRNIRNYYQ